MSEFTKVYKKWHAENNGKYDSAWEYHKALMRKFGDWQPPKPLVVVPQIMADFIEEWKEEFKLYGAFFEISEAYGPGTELYDLVFQKSNGQDLFARAWLDGYTVEKEQLYVLELPRQYNPYVSQVNDLNVITRFAPLFYEAKRLSEKEIKAIDERYWAFAVKVDDVEP